MRVDSQLPRQHKTAVVAYQDGSVKFEIEMADLPIPGPSEALVKISATGVCGTDIGLAAGKLGPAMRILGHEGVGRIVSVGSDAVGAHLKTGMRVGVCWVRDVCGVCEMCLVDGGETRCKQQLNSGRKIDGCFAQYAIVPQRYIVALPEGPPDHLLAPILCGGVTIYKALKICGATPGRWIVISGAGGGVGTLGIQYAKSMGYRVVAIDAGAEKEEICLQLGAEAYIDLLQTKATPARVEAITKGQNAAAVLVVAGSGKAYQDGLEMLAPFGTMVCVGIPPPTELVNFHPLTFIDKGIRILGSAVGSRLDLLEAIEFLERGVVAPSVHIRKLEDLSDIAEQFQSGKAIGKYIIQIDE
ncbi:zinc-binding dehydrogenase [Phlyctema vagabunda]|uniref:Zinc-binding dehydrogenase n=1 Tax=Phlyctema vagabunda TaxID=108571 RepID=A0ABR4P4K5_9HELO